MHHENLAKPSRMTRAAAGIILFLLLAVSVFQFLLVKAEPAPTVKAEPAPNLRVYVGYADNARPDPKFPSPWYGSAGVTNFIGSPCIATNLGCIDAGAVRLDNLGSSPLAVRSVVVTLPGSGCGDDGCLPITFNLWGNFTIPAGGIAILTQFGREGFDTSDYATGSCSMPDFNAGAPIVQVNLQSGQSLTLTDSGYVLDTGRVDPGNCGNNESHQWQLLGQEVGSTLPTFDVSFTETGLAQGTPWQIEFGSYSRQGSSNTISFAGFTAGTYTYSITPPAGYALVSPTCAGSGLVVVTGDTVVPLVFAKASSVSSQSTSGLCATLSPDSVNAIEPGLFGCETQLFCNPTAATTLTIENTGSDSVRWSLSTMNPCCQQDPISFKYSQPSGILAPGSTTYVQVSISTPDVSQTFSDNLIVSGTTGSGEKESVELPFRVTVGGGASGSGSYGDPLTFQATLYKDSGTNTYKFALTITPAGVSGSGGLNYFVLSQGDADFLLQDIISQLQAAGFGTSNVKGFEGVTDISFLSQTAVDNIDAFYGCTSLLESLPGYADLGFKGGLALLTTETALSDGSDLAGGKSLSSICGPGTTPLDIVSTVINNEFSDIAKDQEMSVAQSGGYVCDCSASPLTPYKGDYIVGVGQQFILTIEGLSPSSAGQSGFTLLIGGQNVEIIGTGAGILGPVIGCSYGTLQCHGSGSSMSFNVALHLTQSCFLFWCSSSYSSGTVDISDPLTIPIQASLDGGEFVSPSFDSSTATFSAQLLVPTGAPDFHLANASFLVPVSLSPIGSLNFKLTENGTFVPFTMSPSEGGSYQINASFSKGGMISLQMPAVTPSLTAAEVGGILDIYGVGFAKNSTTMVEYWNGTAWNSLAGGNLSTTGFGYIFFSSSVPSNAQRVLFVRVSDGTGDVAETSVVVNPASTTTLLACGNLVNAGMSIVCTVTVSGFYGLINGENVSIVSSGGGTLNSTSCTINTMSCAFQYTPFDESGLPQNISASYPGDAYNLGSSGSVQVGVGKVSTATSLFCTSPIEAGQQATCTAKVTGISSSANNLTVAFVGPAHGQFSSTRCSLNNGSCSVQFYPSATDGSRQVITAVYFGDADDWASNDTSTIVVNLSMIGGGGGGVLSLIDLGLIGGIPAVAVAVALVLVRRTKVRQRGASTTVQVVAKGNRCPNCASENPSENVYCEKCGTKLG